ncbi:MAG: hypothetical protein KGZ97_04495 [Bacteroidetes bacterium]|nr:hypothetical protein [Bacteroidota bacterium]
MKYKTLLLLITFVYGCSTNENKFCDNLDDFYKHEIIHTELNQNQITVELDSLVIKGINSSFVGFVRVYNNTIYFVDERFGRVFAYDSEMNLINTYLGHGRGPREIDTGPIMDLVSLPSGKHFLIGTSWDCFIYDSTWTLHKRYFLDWRPEHSREEAINNPKPHMRNIYGLNYPRIRGKFHDEQIFYQIYSQNPKFWYVNTREYYECARILCKINSETGIITNILGRHSPVHRQYNYLGALAYSYFDITKDGLLYLCHKPDSLIYVFDTEFNPKYAFGLKGKNMNTDYLNISSLDEMKYHGREEWHNKGYYTAIKVFEEQDLVFRSYAKGAHSNTDGLQIYKGTTLIADIDVPKAAGKRTQPESFTIEGYIAPYFISNAFLDFEKEELKIYRIKINI